MNRRGFFGALLAGLVTPFLPKVKATLRYRLAHRERFYPRFDPARLPA